MKCAYHPDVDAIGTCVNCGRGVCVECKTLLGGKIYCQPCADEVFAKPVKRAEDTAGQGALAVVPSEVKGWNWGAFLLSWIWGLGNNVYIALLSLIPFVGIVMVFVLGAKGSEWAWQNKKWESVEHFKRVQRTWAYWGLGVLLFGVVLWIIYIILIIIVAATGA